MRILVVTTQVPFVKGGAEVLAEDLVKALQDTGHEAELVTIPFKWYPPTRILDQMLACRLLDLSESSGTKIDRVIAMKFPAYLAEHPKKTIWLVHQHRQAYDLWSHSSNDLINSPNGAFIRSAIYAADRSCFAGANGIFTISKNVSRRLKEHCAFESIPLCPPPRNAQLFHCSEPEDFFFFPSRISPAKRQEMVIQALNKCGVEANVVFSILAEIP